MIKKKKKYLIVTIVLVFYFWAPEKVIFDICYAVFPPPEAQSTPMVSIWTCTPNFMYCLAYQSSNRSYLQIRFILFHFLLHLVFLGPFFWQFLTPTVPVRVPKVPIWYWVPRFTTSDDQKCKSAKKKSSFCHFSRFGLLGTWKSSFWHLLCRLNPLMRPKVSPRSPYGLRPLISCIASPTNQKNRSYLRIWFIFFIFFHSMFFALIFWPFLTPHYAYMCAQGPYMDLNPEFYYLSIESAKKWTLFIDSVPFFQFSPFWGHFVVKKCNIAITIIH